ncbi:hypothetical protein MTO96_033771 [Rhipicephalus appendiculatus]
MPPSRTSTWTLKSMRCLTSCALSAVAAGAHESGGLVRPPLGCSHVMLKCGIMKGILDGAIEPDELCLLRQDQVKMLLQRGQSVPIS